MLQTILSKKWILGYFILLSTSQQWFSKHQISIACPIDKNFFNLSKLNVRQIFEFYITLFFSWRRGRSSGRRGPSGSKGSRRSCNIQYILNFQKSINYFVINLFCVNLLILVFNFEVCWNSSNFVKFQIF